MPGECAVCVNVDGEGGGVYAGGREAEETR